MRDQYDDNNIPKIQDVVAEYRQSMQQRIRWIGPLVGAVVLVLLVANSTYSVAPGEVGSCAVSGG
jgi:hypothetical protein